MVEPHPGLLGRPAYLDYNATTPIDPRATEAEVLGAARTIADACRALTG